MKWMIEEGDSALMYIVHRREPSYPNIKVFPWKKRAFSTPEVRSPFWHTVPRPCRKLVSSHLTLSNQETGKCSGFWDVKRDTRQHSSPKVVSTIHTRRLTRLTRFGGSIDTRGVPLDITI